MLLRSGNILWHLICIQYHYLICGFSILSDWHLKKLQSLEMNDVFLPNVWNVSFDVLTINAPITMAWISYDVAVKYLPFVFVFLACWREGETRKENGKLQNFWCISDWGSAILLQGRQRGCFRPSEPIPQMMNVCEKLWGGEVCHKPDMLGMPTTKLFCCSFL